MHIPPYVWIHIKNFMLQAYWLRKYGETLQELPKSDKNICPGRVLTTATKTPQFIKEFERTPFQDRISTIYSVVNHEVYNNNYKT